MGTWVRHPGARPRDAENVPRAERCGRRGSRFPRERAENVNLECADGRRRATNTRPRESPGSRTRHAERARSPTGQLLDAGLGHGAIDVPLPDRCSSSPPPRGLRRRARRRSRRWPASAAALLTCGDGRGDQPPIGGLSVGDHRAHIADGEVDVTRGGAHGAGHGRVPGPSDDSARAAWTSGASDGLPLTSPSADAGRAGRGVPSTPSSSGAFAEAWAQRLVAPMATLEAALERAGSRPGVGGLRALLDQRRRAQASPARRRSGGCAG